MTRRLLAGLAAGLLAAWALAAAPPTLPSPARGEGKGGGAGAADDVQDVILLADARPVFLRLHIEIDGKPFRAAHAEALRACLDGLFTQLDSNGDGVLSEEEARRMPSPFKPPATAGGSTVHVAFNYRVVDADGDGKITREEMAAYYREFSGGAAQVQPAGRTIIPPAVDQALFNLLDTNKDGKLSKEELAAAADVLFPLDQDRDELISPQEVAPAFYAAGVQNPNESLPPQPNMRQSIPRAASLFLVRPDEDRAALISSMWSLYRSGSDAVRPAKLTEQPPDAELIVRLGKRAAGQAALTVLRPAGKDAAGDGGVTLTFGGVHLDLRVNGDLPEQPAGTRRRYLELFRGEAGEKGRIGAEQAQQAGFFPNQFALLDRDGDGELTEREFVDYLDGVQDRQARLIGATPSLLLSGRARTLFGWLDRDGDGRLSLRELREAPKLLDRMGVDAVSRADFPEGYQMAIGAGRASFGRAGPDACTPPEAPMLSLDWSGPDLLWFRKMDRNGDGDISPREFLGTADDFKRLDADGDGLISREEAERFKK